MADNKFILKFSGDTTALQGAVAQANSTLTGFANKVRSYGGMMAAGFAVSQIGEFVMDVSKLAGEAEGVRVAFERLPAATKLMLDLKEATSGTVSELDLMKRSVMAANFGISLKALPELLEFASIRAKQTGQSVDYLVDSIVTGIGRKSKLILDNLGISAVALGEAMNGVSMEAATVGEVAEAVGKIASENLKQMGEMSENASTKLERLSANWVNLKVAMGDAANGTGVLGTAIDALSGYMVVLASDNLTATEKIAAFSGAMGLSVALSKDMAMNAGKAADEQKKIEQVIKEVDRAMASGNPEAYIKAQQQHIYYADIMAEYQSRLPKPIELTTEEIEKQAKALDELNKKLYEQAEAERFARLAKLERSLKPPKIDVLGQQEIKPPSFDLKAIASMNDAMAGLKLRNDEYNASLLTQRDSLIENTMMFSEMVGAILGGSQNIGQAMAGMAAMVVEAVGRMIMAQMIQKAIQDKATDFNFFAKLALIGVATATASSLLRRIGKPSGGGGGGFGGGGGSFGGGSYGTRMESVGQRIELTFTGDAGKVLKASLVKQDRIDSRTRS